MDKPTIGSISEGTLRNEDLIPCFADALKEIDQHHELVKEAYEMMASWGDNEVEELEEMSELTDALMDALSENAPPYCYFGSAEGDGASFGFWPMEPENIVDFNSEVIKCDAGSEPEYILSVNDHGNVTLYKVTLEEVWSIV